MSGLYAGASLGCGLAAAVLLGFGLAFVAFLWALGAAIWLVLAIASEATA